MPGVFAGSDVKAISWRIAFANYRPDVPTSRLLWGAAICAMSVAGCASNSDGTSI